MENFNMSKPIGPLWSGKLLPFLLLITRPMIVIVLKDSFFTIPLKVQDKEKIGFAVSSYKGTQPEK